MKGKGNLILTGKLGEVMRESAQAALSYARSRARQFRLDPDFLAKNDLHVHVPEGAIPKDGPSAGVTMAVAMISVLTNRPVRRNVALTGEITLRGNILPVGGVKEKILAARRARLDTVVLPRLNGKDLQDLPDYVRRDMRFELAEEVDAVLKLALLPARKESPARPEPRLTSAKPASAARGRRSLAT
jgi:ATP-dependent Lon protease